MQKGERIIEAVKASVAKDTSLKSTAAGSLFGMSLYEPSGVEDLGLAPEHLREAGSIVRLVLTAQGELCSLTLPHSLEAIYQAHRLGGEVRLPSAS
jgi:hypothetical protein